MWNIVTSPRYPPQRLRIRESCPLAKQASFASSCSAIPQMAASVHRKFERPGAGICRSSCSLRLRIAGTRLAGIKHATSWPQVLWFFSNTRLRGQKARVLAKTNDLQTADRVLGLKDATSWPQEPSFLQISRVRGQKAYLLAKSDELQTEDRVL